MSQVNGEHVHNLSSSRSSLTGAHLHLDTISSSLPAGWCQYAWHALSQQMSCVVLRAHVPCFMLYALLDTDARRYGNFVHLQISPETYLPTPLPFPPPSQSNLIIPYCFSCPTIRKGLLGVGETERFNVIIETLLSPRGVARVRCAVMDAACQNAYWWSAKTQFAVIRQLPSNYVSARAFLKPSNSNPSLFSEWLDHCPWQTGTKWAALCMLPLMFYWFA